MLVEEEMSRSPGRVVGLHDTVSGPQPQAVVLGGTKVLMDDVGRMTPSDQVFDILIEDHTERVGSESAKVMGALEDRLEHGCPPGEEKEPRREHPDYAEPCQQRGGQVRAKACEQRAERRVRLRIIPRPA